MARTDVTVFDRRVVGIDEARLEFGQQARKAARGQLLLLTPVGGMERYERTVMNLAACTPDGGLAWVLPVDGSRLNRASADDATARLFDSFWGVIDRAAIAAPGSGVIWEPSTAVGLRPPGTSYWVEYEQPRPWLELASLADGSALLVACTASSLKRRGSRLQHDVPAAAISPAATARILLKIDMTLELAHFAVLNPKLEDGWVSAGHLGATQLLAAQRAFHQFPQRGADSHVLRDG